MLKKVINYYRRKFDATLDRWENFGSSVPTDYKFPGRRLSYLNAPIECGAADLIFINAIIGSRKKAYYLWDYIWRNIAKIVALNGAAILCSYYDSHYWGGEGLIYFIETYITNGEPLESNPWGSVFFLIAAVTLLLIIFTTEAIDLANQEVCKVSSNFCRQLSEYEKWFEWVENILNDNNNLIEKHNYDRFKQATAPFFDETFIAANIVYSTMRVTWKEVLIGGFAFPVAEFYLEWGFGAIEFLINFPGFSPTLYGWSLIFMFTATIVASILWFVAGLEYYRELDFLLNRANVLLDRYEEVNFRADHATKIYYTTNICGF